MTPAAHATAAIIEERYRQLAEWRRWFRCDPAGQMFAERWADLRTGWDAERRKLVLVRWGARTARRAARPLVAMQPPPNPCEYCRGRGYVSKPCPLCGAIRLRQGGMAYQAGSVWGDSPPEVAPRRRGRKSR